MVDLVLQTGGEEALGLDFAPLIVLVEIANANFRRPGHFLVIFGDRQAAFLIDRFVLGKFKDFGIGEKLRRRLLVLFRQIPSQ